MKREKTIETTDLMTKTEQRMLEGGARAHWTVGRKDGDGGVVKIGRLFGSKVQAEEAIEFLESNGMHDIRERFGVVYLKSRDPKLRVNGTEYIDLEDLGDGSKEHGRDDRRRPHDHANGTD